MCKRGSGGEQQNIHKVRRSITSKQQIRPRRYRCIHSFRSPQCPCPFPRFVGSVTLLAIVSCKQSTRITHSFLNSLTCCILFCPSIHSSVCRSCPLRYANRRRFGLIFIPLSLSPQSSFVSWPMAFHRLTLALAAMLVGTSSFGGPTIITLLPPPPSKARTVAKSN